MDRELNVDIKENRGLKQSKQWLTVKRSGGVRNYPRSGW